MKTLSDYKRMYAGVKTRFGKNKAFNSAMLNLTESEQSVFVRWQTERSKKTTK